MNPTDLRDKLLKKAREATKGMILCQDSQVEYMASFALPYAERAAELQAEITRLQEKYDENGYDAPALIKLKRIEDAVDSGFMAYQQQLAAAQQRVKELEVLYDQTRMHKANLHKMYDELHDKAVQAGIIKSAIKE